VMGPTSSGQTRGWPPRKSNFQEFRASGDDVPAGTVASARSAQALRSFTEAIAIYTLIRQPPPTPLCRGLSPYRGENSETGRYSMESLTSYPRVREQSGSVAEVNGCAINVSSRELSGRSRKKLTQFALIARFA
jgi:hypothetical protein